ncbi:MAG: hypothetical protein WBE37_33195 [Bryobacteraceae bacterium]
MARFETSPWSVPPRLPLGDAFSGQCRAPGNTAQPGETRMREACNLGLGSHGCEQFPLNSASDAIRFHVAKDSGELIHIQYVFEKECWPGEHGSFDYSVSQKLSSARVDETLRRQAEAFLESYLRRRSEA